MRLIFVMGMLHALAVTQLSLSCQSAVTQLSQSCHSAIARLSFVDVTTRTYWHRSIIELRNTVPFCRLHSISALLSSLCGAAQDEDNDDKKCFVTRPFIVHSFRVSLSDERPMCAYCAETPAMNGELSGPSNCCCPLKQLGPVRL